MNKQLQKSMEIVDSYLQVYKRTGEIKKSYRPHYRGKELSSVYGRYSDAKKQAYKNCMEFLDSIGWEFVTSYGITSATCYQFTFAAVVELEEKFVIWFSSSRDNISYYGDKYNTCSMNIKAYILEEGDEY